MLKLVREVPNTTEETGGWDPHLHGGRTEEQVKANQQEAVLLVRIVIASAVVGGTGWVLWQLAEFLVSFWSGF